jgi:putative membrane protein
MRTLVLLLMSATAVNAAQPAAAPISKATTDQQNSSAMFVRKATQDGMLEIEAGKLALSRSTDASIKTFAQRMVNEHSAANVELQKVAGTRYEIPVKLDADHQAKLELLMGKTGGDFDQAYSTEMIKSHEQAVKLFTEATSDSVITPELQQFARKTLPTLQQHQMQSMQLPGERKN